MRAGFERHAGDVAAQRPVAPLESTHAELTAKLHRLRAEAHVFARLSPREKARLLRAALGRFSDLSERMVEQACLAKGVDPRSQLAGEEWFSGPCISIRAMRLFADALDAVAEYGAPRIETTEAQSLPNGRTSVRALPGSGYDRAVFPGWSAEVWLDGRIRPGAVAEAQASFYRRRDPEGKVTLVLGAGNVASISVLDVLYHSFVEGAVCLLKMSPVNAYLGPFFELAFEPFVTRGFFAIAYGGPDIGAFLVDHPLVDAIHVTGSIQTHDRIVWGPPGPERDARKSAGRPLTRKPITSELGNVSPVLVVPTTYSDRELDTIAWKIAGMVAQNASFNCVAGKLIVTARGFAQRDELLARLGRLFESTPTRVAHYPGAEDRHRSLVSAAGDARVQHFGEGGGGKLPWTLISGVDSESDSPLFTTEPFCSIITETQVSSTDPVEFLSEATDFVNDSVWGTLNATVMIPGRLEHDARVGRALDDALVALRYGTVGVNLWPAVSYGLGSTPWGGYPGSTLADAQSGIGWGHDALMLEEVEKVICRTPLLGLREYVWYPGHRRLAELGRALARLEAQPRPSGVLGAAWALVRR